MTMLSCFRLCRILSPVASAGVILALSVAPPSAAGAQRVGLGVGYVSPNRALAVGAGSGVVVGASADWLVAHRFLGWRVDGSFTNLPGVATSFGNRLPALRVYTLAAGAVLSAPMGSAVRPYVVVGPGLYGQDAYTRFQLGVHGVAGLEVPIGRWGLFGEYTISKFSNARPDPVRHDARLRSLSFGLRY